MEQIDCMSCGTQTNARRFENESFAIEYGGAKATVDGLSGERCVVCDEKVFEPDSAWRYAAASDDLVLRHRKDTQNEIRRINANWDRAKQPQRASPVAGTTPSLVTNEARRRRCRR